MAEADAAIGGDPHAGAVGAAMRHHIAHPADVGPVTRKEALSNTKAPTMPHIH